jgi:hypothetical protein
VAESWVAVMSTALSAAVEVADQTSAAPVPWFSRDTNDQLNPPPVTVADCGDPDGPEVATKASISPGALVVSPVAVTAPDAVASSAVSTPVEVHLRGSRVRLGR